jgi:hypothetical protein
LGKKTTANFFYHQKIEGKKTLRFMAQQMIFVSKKTKTKEVNKYSIRRPSSSVQFSSVGGGPPPRLQASRCSFLSVRLPCSCNSFVPSIISLSPLAFFFFFVFLGDFL